MSIIKIRRRVKKVIATYYSCAFIAIAGFILLLTNKIKHFIKPNAKHDFAIICYLYEIETSPFLKSLCSYFYDKGYDSTDVFVYKLGRSNLLSQKGICVVKFNSIIVDVLNKYLLLSMQVLYVLLLKVYLKTRDYKYIFAVDYQSLNFINKVSFPLDKVIFLSMEGTDYMRLYPLSEVLKTLPKCRSYIIASKERGQEINDFLKLNLPFTYFPISLRPKTQITKPLSSNLNIIYSGYFAKWSALEDLIDSYINSFLANQLHLYLQGHFYGTGDYLQAIKTKVDLYSNITIDTNYYSDDEHSVLLSNFDIGIAFYKNLTGTDNFENLIFSSGKIASYLWAGLAVMTNIDCALTKIFPFIFVEDLNAENFQNGLTLFQNNKEEFRRSAYKLAQAKYNFDTYMDEIFQNNFVNVEPVYSIAEN